MPKAPDSKQSAILLEAQKMWLGHLIGYTDNLDISYKTLLRDKRSRERLTRWLLSNEYIRQNGAARLVTAKVYQVLTAVPPQSLDDYQRHDRHWLDFMALPPAQQKWLLEHPADYLWTVQRQPWRAQPGVTAAYLPVTEPVGAVQRALQQDRAELARVLRCAASRIDVHYHLFFTTPAFKAQAAAAQQQFQQTQREQALRLAPQFNLHWGLLRLGLCPPPKHEVPFNTFTTYPRSFLEHESYPRCPMEADALAQWFTDAAARLTAECAQIHQSYVRDLEWLQHVVEAVKQRYGSWEEALRHYHDEVRLELEQRWHIQEHNAPEAQNGTTAPP